MVNRKIRFEFRLRREPMDPVKREMYLEIRRIMLFGQPDKDKEDNENKPDNLEKPEEQD